MINYNYFLTFFLIFAVKTVFGAKTPGYLVEIRSNTNDHKCYGTIISSKMVLAPASCLEKMNESDLLILTGDQHNLTSLENLPNLQYERVIRWYEDQCNRVDLEFTTLVMYMEILEGLKAIVRSEIPKIPEKDTHSASKIVMHPFYSTDDQIFNIAAIILNDTVSIEDHLNLNLAFKIPKHVDFHLNTEESYEFVNEKVCGAIFPAIFSNKTHFCVTSNQKSEDQVIGKAVLNSQEMFGLVLAKKESTLLVLNIAKFVSFVQAVEANKDFAESKSKIDELTRIFVGKIMKEMAFM